MKSIAEILRDEFPKIEYQAQTMVSRTMEEATPVYAMQDIVMSQLKAQIANAVCLKIHIDKNADPTSMSYVYRARVFAFTPDELSRLINRFYWTGVEDERNNNTCEKPKEPKGLREMKRLIRLEDSTVPQKKDKRHIKDAFPYLEPLEPKLKRRKRAK